MKKTTAITASAITKRLAGRTIPTSGVSRCGLEIVLSADVVEINCLIVEASSALVNDFRAPE
jgi:hypothetical protein